MLALNMNEPEQEEEQQQQDFLLQNNDDEKKNPFDSVDRSQYEECNRTLSRLPSSEGGGEQKWPRGMQQYQFVSMVLLNILVVALIFLSILFLATKDRSSRVSKLRVISYFINKIHICKYSLKLQIFLF